MTREEIIQMLKISTANQDVEVTRYWAEELKKWDEIEKEIVEYNEKLRKMLIVENYINEMLVSKNMNDDEIGIIITKIRHSYSLPYMSIVRFDDKIRLVCIEPKPKH